MSKLPDDLTRLKGGIRPIAVGDRWAPDTPSWIVADLEKSDITPTIAAATRLAWTDSRERIAHLLNRRSRLPDGTCLLFPYFDAAGEPIDYCRAKPERPRAESRDGEERAVKYEAPSGCPPRPYRPPAAGPGLLDPEKVLIVTEGEKKVLSLIRHGFLAVGVAGVWSLLKKVEGVEKGRSFEDYEFAWPGEVQVAGKLVILLFDSDTAANGNLPLALKYIRQHLAARGAAVRVARLPDGPNGEKVGADDYLVAHDPAALQQILDAAKDPTANRPSKNGVGEEKEKKPSAADVLTAIGVGLELWHDSEDRGYASIGRPTYAIKSKAFKTLLVARYRQETDGKVANSDAICAAPRAIEGDAVHDRPECDVHVRVAESGGRVYVHLADTKDTVIEIGPDGWRECENPGSVHAPARDPGAAETPAGRPPGRPAEVP